MRENGMRENRMRENGMRENGARENEKRDWSSEARWGSLTPLPQHIAICSKRVARKVSAQRTAARTAEQQVEQAEKAEKAEKTKLEGRGR